VLGVALGRALSRDEHEMLDELLGQILLTETQRRVGQRAIAGILAHLIVAAARDDEAELNSWLRDPGRFAKWRASASGLPSV
jgi:hypothetical protein